MTFTMSNVRIIYRVKSGGPMNIEIRDFDAENEKIAMIKDGIEIECNVLFTFNSDDTKRSYVGFTDNTIASNGRKNIYVQSFDPLASEIKFENITNEDELEMLNEFLIQIDESSN